MFPVLRKTPEEENEQQDAHHQPAVWATDEEVIHLINRPARVANIYIYLFFFQNSKEVNVYIKGPFLQLLVHMQRTIIHMTYCILFFDAKFLYCCHRVEAQLWFTNVQEGLSSRTCMSHNQEHYGLTALTDMSSVLFCFQVDMHAEKGALEALKKNQIRS